MTVKNFLGNIQTHTFPTHTLACPHDVPRCLRRLSQTCPKRDWEVPEGGLGVHPPKNFADFKPLRTFFQTLCTFSSGIQNENARRWGPRFWSTIGKKNWFFEILKTRDSTASSRNAQKRLESAILASPAKCITSAIIYTCLKCSHSWVCGQECRDEKSWISKILF